MKSTMRFLISLFFVLTISACSDYFIFTSVPDFLVNTSWSELVGEDDKMYVYQFFDNDGDLITKIKSNIASLFLRHL